VYQLRQCASVDRMTYNAVSTFFLPVHVNIMEVPVAVSEPGSKRGLWIEQKVPLMAGETECVLILGIGHVHVLWKLLYQQTGVCRPVRVMARRALALLIGP